MRIAIANFIFVHMDRIDMHLLVLFQDLMLVRIGS